MRAVKTVVNWVRKLVTLLTRRKSFIAQTHGVTQTSDMDSLFHEECLKLLRKLQEAPEKELKHSVMLKRMHTSAKNFHAIVDLLELEGDIEIVTIPNRTGRAKRSYRLTKGGFNDGSRKA